MNEFFLPWVEMAITIPMIAAIAAFRIRDPSSTRRIALVACGLSLGCSLGAWLNMGIAGSEPPSQTAWSFLGNPVLAVDGLTAPILPLMTLLYLLIVLATLGAKVGKISFPWLLVSEAILLATFSSRAAWIIIGLLSLGVVPPLIELHQNGGRSRLFTLHMTISVALLAIGQLLIASADRSETAPIAGVALVMAGLLLRSGMPPAHLGMLELFEGVSFGTALLFVTPIAGLYGAIRLILPIAPPVVLNAVAILSIVAALYAACMALVQREARWAFCYLFISNSSLVFVGLAIMTPVSVAATLCAWLTVSLSMAGFGLTLRAIEMRMGRLSLREFHGLFSQTPRLAALALITGLASVGFPGTIGFISMELLIASSVKAYPLIGVGIVVAAALNSLAVLQIYFRIFTGVRHNTSIDLRSRPPERIVVIALTAIILGVGLYPQPEIGSRYAVALKLVEQRTSGQPKPESQAYLESDIANLPQ